MFTFHIQPSILPLSKLVSDIISAIQPNYNESDLSNHAAQPIYCFLSYRRHFIDCSEAMSLILTYSKRFIDQTNIVSTSDVIKG